MNKRAAGAFNAAVDSAKAAAGLDPGRNGAIVIAVVSVTSALLAIAAILDEKEARHGLQGKEEGQGRQGVE